jgi:hypothetical protein
MSIPATIQAAIGKGDLCFLPLQVPSDTTVRHMVLHPQIAADLAQSPNIPRMFELQGELESFVRGEHMTMCFTPFKHKEARIGLLDPVSLGICDIRCRHRKPGIRVLGRFAARDCFVGLEWRPRSVPIEGFDKVVLSDSRSGDEWTFASLEVEQRWEQILGDAPFVLGGNISDYISTNCSRYGP